MRCAASTCHGGETQAGSWQLLLLECGQGAGVTQHPLQILPRDPLPPPYRQDYTRCTRKETLHPNLPPAPSSFTDECPKAPCRHPGSAPRWIPTELTLLLQLSTDKPVVHPAPAGPSFIKCCEGGAATTQASTVLPECPAARWERDLPKHTTTQGSLGRTAAAHFPTAPWKHFYTNTLSK